MKFRSLRKWGMKPFHYMKSILLFKWENKIWTKWGDEQLGITAWYDEVLYRAECWSPVGLGWDRINQNHSWRPPFFLEQFCTQRKTFIDILFTRWGFLSRIFTSQLDRFLPENRTMGECCRAVSLRGCPGSQQVRSTQLHGIQEQHRRAVPPSLNLSRSAEMQKGLLCALPLFVNLHWMYIELPEQKLSSSHLDTLCSDFWKQ